MIHGDEPITTHTLLLVDDYEPWRRVIRGEVGKQPRWRVIGEAADGIEAVRLSQALEPDLVLLDVGLPEINGLEAARRMLDDRPDARILFLTEQHSADIAEAAIEAGAAGYLVKIDAGTDLLFAMEAVVNGGRFMAAGLLDQVAGPPRQPHHHEAGFHSGEVSLLDEYTRFAAAALADGNTLIYVGTELRRQELRQRLRRRGFDVDRLVTEDRCLLLDLERVLATLMVNGVIDEAAFRNAAVPLFDRAQSTSQGRVAACGDAAATLFSRGQVDDAVRLEGLWDAFARERQFDLFCGYSIDVPRLAGNDYVRFQSICREHSLVHVR